MGELMRSTDWSKTKLGPVDRWPKSLQTMLGVLLGSRFPMLLWWGPDLLHLYNDAYRPILRDKHPASLAAPAAEVWAEVWDLVGPMIRGVQAGGPSTWTEDLQLFIHSDGMAEETYFTFSYSPVPGDDGRVGGVLNTVQETTAKVQSERQIRTLHDLAARAADAKSEDEAYRLAAEALSSNDLDLPFFLIYSSNEQAHTGNLVASGGWKEYTGPANPDRVPLRETEGAAHWPVAETIRTARAILIEDLDARFGAMPLGRWNARPERAIALPLSRAGQSAPAVLIAGLSPHRAFDDRYQRFFHAVGDQLTALIADARALEEERKRAAALAEIDRAKTAFFSNVSHEFRTPLTLMLGPLDEELAERTDPLPPARRERLETAQRNTLRLLKLVNNLLDFSRIEAGRIHAHYEPTDLAAYTAELASAFRSAVEKGGLRLTVDCPPLPEQVYVDRDMWEKIVLNLLSNAFKHTFQGDIRVSVRWCGEEVQLEVADSGVGIPETELSHLFDRFHRVKGAKSRTHEGTGIGLALVQELARSHGGRVEVESCEGVGSRFTVTVKAGTEHLPAGHIAPEGSRSTGTRAAYFAQEALRWISQDLPSLTQPASIGALASMNGAHEPDHRLGAAAGGRARILWADDNSDMREYVRRILAAEYTVTAVPDGAAAVQAALAAPPDLVLTDIMMPGFDGFGVLRELRAHERTRTIPVILLSARAGEESAVEGLDAGADDYLVKPFSARELMARVRTHLEMARLRRKVEIELDLRVQERTAELVQTTKELEAENAERTLTAHRLEAQLARMNLLDQITRAVAERQDLRSIYQVVVRSVEESLPVDFCCMTRYDPEASALTVTCIGQRADSLAAELVIADGGHIDLGENLRFHCVRGQLIYEPSVCDHGAPFLGTLTSAGLNSLVAAPLRAQSQVFGVLLAARRQPEGFSSGECEFLRQLSEHVALAAHQAELHGALQDAYDELRRSQATLMQQERLRALGQMASGMAHDINNAVSPIALYTESLLQHETGLSARARDCLDIIQRAIQDVAGTVARMREFYRPRESELPLARVDLNRIVNQVVSLTRARWSDLPQQQGIAIDLRADLAPDLPMIMGAEGELRDALTNLIFNAVDAMPDGGTLTLRTHAKTCADPIPSPAPVRVEVTDTGSGMDEEARRRCIEPFFTTKGERGTGLGLAMVYGMAQRHNAQLDIESAPGQGTTIRLTFRPAESPSASVFTPSGGACPTQPLRVLLIDDDPVLRNSMQDILQEDGHTVATADGGQKGIDVFLEAQRGPDPFEVVITDLGMPHVDGRRVAASIKLGIAPNTGDPAQRLGPPDTG